MIRSVLFALILTLFIPLAATAQDEDIIGTLAEAEGTIMATAADATTAPVVIAAGAPVRLNDTIETGADSRALILFIDDTELTLSSNSRATIDDYVFDGEGAAANKGRFSILNGAFLFVSGLLGKAEQPDVTVSTPYGTIGIRGTEFSGADIDGEYSVFVKQGKVSVQTNRGRLLVAEGQGTGIRNIDSIPSRPAAWGAEKIERLNGFMRLKNPEGARARIATLKEKHPALREKHKTFMQKRRQMAPPQDGQRSPRRVMNKPTGSMPGHAAGREDAAEAKKRGIESFMNDRPTVTMETAPAAEPAKTTPETEAGKAAPDAATAQTSPAAPATPAPTAPETAEPPSTQDLNKPIEAPATTPPPLPEKSEAPTKAPAVALPALGTNDAQTNELQEQQHIKTQSAGEKQPSGFGPEAVPAPMPDKGSSGAL